MVTIEESSRTFPVALPGVDLSFITREVGAAFAEEYEGTYSGDKAAAVRSALSSQFAPIIEVLETRFDGITGLLGLGPLAHVPFAGLKRKGGSLASACQPVTPSARSRFSHVGNNQPSCPRTLLVVDTSFKTHPRQIPDNIVRKMFDSSTGDTSIAEVMSDLDSFDRFVFFGHGQVDSFAHENQGLVMAELGAGERLLYRLDPAIHDGFTRLKDVILVACSAGQGNIFVDGAPTLASRFIQKGVRTVVAPIWPITSSIGTRFLEQWFRTEAKEPDLTNIQVWAKLIDKDPNSFMSFSFNV